MQQMRKHLRIYLLYALLWQLKLYAVICSGNLPIL